MKNNQSNTCNCGTCKGAGCTCGCQLKASSRKSANDRTTCDCGANCACGSSCSCKAGK